MHPFDLGGLAHAVRSDHGDDEPATCGSAAIHRAAGEYTVHETRCAVAPGPEAVSDRVDEGRIDWSATTGSHQSPNIGQVFAMNPDFIAVLSDPASKLQIGAPAPGAFIACFSTREQELIDFPHPVAAQNLP